jgi:DNA-binding YbaB/EbfC family protein
MNLQKLMKQAQAMQANMAQAQARLAAKEFTAEAAGGKIKATADGSGMIKAITIDPAVVDPDDAEFLQTLVLKAVQDALNGAKSMAEAEMRKVTGGLGFPM